MSRPVIGTAKCSRAVVHQVLRPVVINLQNVKTSQGSPVVTTAATLWAQLEARGWERSALVELDTTVEAFVVIQGPNTQRFTPKLKPGNAVRLKLKKGDRLEFHGLGAFGPLLVSGVAPVDAPACLGD